MTAKWVWGYFSGVIKNDLKLDCAGDCTYL